MKKPKPETQWSEYLAPVPAEALAAELSSQGYRVKTGPKPPGRTPRCDCGSCPLCKHRARNQAYRRAHKKGAQPKPPATVAPASLP